MQHALRHLPKAPGESTTRDGAGGLSGHQAVRGLLEVQRSAQGDLINPMNECQEDRAGKKDRKGLNGRGGGGLLMPSLP